MITTANGSISGGQHSSNSTPTANTSTTSTSTTVGLQKKKVIKLIYKLIVIV